MKKEELEKEAEDWIGDYTSVPCSCMFLKYDYTNLVEAYIASAEPREKRIAEFENTNKRISDECHKLVDSLEQKQKKIAELEKQIEKMKCCHNCRKFHNLSYDCTCAEVCNEWEIKENDKI